GQTIPTLIVDIARVPTGALSLTSIYVALSRSKGRDMIRLLRDVDEKALLDSIDPALMSEDQRLNELDKATRVWWAKVREAESV
ncbi:hypothetical protein FB446DRAFT_655497, partial [Lentinula raphanica]